jgi:hypothetical protein
MLSIGVHTIDAQRLPCQQSHPTLPCSTCHGINPVRSAAAYMFATCLEVVRRWVLLALVDSAETSSTSRALFAN